MPVVIAIAILVIIRRLAQRPRRNYFPVYDPIKAQKEKDRQRREADRIADRQRRNAEQDRKRKEQEEKRIATATANQCKADQYMILARQYRDYIKRLQEEKNDSSISLTRENQIEKEILKAKEKIIKLTTEADKAHYHAKAYFDNFSDPG